MKKSKFLIIPILILVFVVAVYFVAFKKIPLCANSISCIENLNGEKQETKEGEFLGEKITVPENLLADKAEENVLGEATTNDAKHIYVDLTNQALYAYENNNLVYTFPVSTGKWGRTPTGDFRIWIKLRYTRMEGGDPKKNTYYNLPNVPYTMYFYNNEIPKSRGYGLHGAYWHNNFGHPMSHGCVNMRIADAGTIYYWSNPQPAKNTTYASDSELGTLITIYGVAPKE